MSNLLLWLPKELAHEVPALFIDRLSATAQVLSCDLDGIKEDLNQLHPSDNPLQALMKFQVIANDLVKRLNDEADEIRSLIRGASSLLDSKEYVREVAVEEVPSEQTSTL